jgi:6-phosphogluconolactonase (cycloisomerase 2 family)
MESAKNKKLGDFESMFSRRDLLKGAGALTAAASVPGAFGPQATAAPLTTGAPLGTVWLYIGTYTGAPGAFGSNGMGIYLCELNLVTGNLSVLSLVGPVETVSGITTNSPSTLALDPTRTHLYAGNEYGPPGAVTAYSIDRLTGALTPLNAQPTKGAPAHVSVDHAGKFLFAAEYTGGWFEAFQINSDGSLGPAVFQQSDPTNDGVQHAADGPPGSFAISAHEIGGTGHPHQMEADPSNKWVLGPDAGQDRIYVWRLDPGAHPPLTLSTSNPGGYVNVPPAIVNSGDGPRHFAFHPNGIWMYSIQEEASTIIFWLFDPATGKLSLQQMVPSVPPGFAGTDFTSEIRVNVTLAGAFVYGANRTSDTIGVFKIGLDGKLTQVSHASTLGDYPRIFTIDPVTGLFVAVANQRADNVTTFKIDPGSGALNFTGNYTPVGSPSGMVFLT